VSDPGVSFKCATLLATWRLLGFQNNRGQTPISGIATGSPRKGELRKLESDPNYLPEDASDAIEELALASGMRSRRVILDAGWWKHAATPMIARVADRRRVSPG
jgi:hypothetical protein